MSKQKKIKFSQKLWNEILDRIADGESVNKILQDEKYYNKSSFYKLLATRPELVEGYDAALRARSNHFLEKLLDDVHDPETLKETLETEDGKLVKRYSPVLATNQKTRVDLLKWYMGCLEPKKYGKIVTNKLTGENGGPIEHTITKIELVAVPCPEYDESDEDNSVTIRDCIYPS